MQFWSIFWADYYVVLEHVAATVTLLIFISSLDDLFIDAYYWIKRLNQWLRSKHPTLVIDHRKLAVKSEQPLAIMVPAWLEYDVIASMIENMVAVLDYRSYVVFVGTYVNDAATITEVQRMQRRYRQLRRVEVPNPGPTCKADCLNWIVQAIVLHEQQTGESFAGVILHDSEDVLNPLELRLFNWMLPEYDMIQLPVASLEREWHELIASSYMDEFSEWHTKDLIVRESLCGMVPSAGVGTCFSRRAVAGLMAYNRGQAFNTDSLTEDYDIGARLSSMGMKTTFAQVPVPTYMRKRALFGFGRTYDTTVMVPLCVQEYFPSTFKAAYRQKSRWALGIGMQGWEQIGWADDLKTNYFFFRDRKGVFTAFISVMAYVLLLQFSFFYVAHELGYWEIRFPPILTENAFYLALLYVNGIALVLRTVQRAYFVGSRYSLMHGLLSAPRIIVTNLINFMAIARAWRLYLSHRILGTRLVWDKTMHDFPSAEKLGSHEQSIEELLMAWQVINVKQLELARTMQMQSQKDLVEILIDQGWATRESIEEARAFQQGNQP